MLPKRENHELTQKYRSGAAYLPDEVRQRISAQLKPDCIVSQGWGMSELVGAILHITLITLIS
jgi:acyl-CoA synthetase (AMP-forming)/AMP-acid ligase II